MPIDEESVGFSLPAPIRDFLFDIHEAVRVSLRADDVHRLYDIKYKEITDKYFPKSSLPDANAIASEVRHDQVFLLIYGEMAMRHLTTKLKPQLADHLASWKNYKQLFDSILQSSDRDLLLTTPWIYDIMQEFTYQFQGFCQYRYLTNHNADNLETLKRNRDAWNFEETFAILNSLIEAARTREADPQSTVVQQFGYFANIELARLQCLLGDYNSSLAAVGAIKLQDRNELFNRSPICHFNLFYHIGVSQLMLGRFEEAFVTFSDAVLNVLSLNNKPGRQGVSTQLNRMVEKALALLIIVSTITPYFRLDDAIKTVLQNKYDDKIKRLANQDVTCATELFESSCPKFISPAIPDYLNPRSVHSEVFEQQVRALVSHVSQELPFLKVRNFLSMYKSIDISKLAQFTGIPESDLKTLLTNRLQQKAAGARPGDYLQFHLEGDVLIVDKASAKQQSLDTDRVFLAGIRKQKELVATVNKTFSDLKL